MTDPTTLPPGIVTNATRLLGQPDGVQGTDPDHFTVASLRHAGQRLRVYRNGSQWRFNSDRRSNQDAPCAHILAVLAKQGLIALPGQAEGGTKISSEVETRADQLSLTRLPELLAQLLAANPGRDAAYRGYGRPPRPVYPQAFQAIIRTAFRYRRLATDPVDDRAHNPWGRVSRATLARFLDSPEQREYLRVLAEATVAPGRAFEQAPWQQRTLRFRRAEGGSLDLLAFVSPRHGLWQPTTAVPGVPVPALEVGQVAFTHDGAQQSEALCQLIAHNLRRLIAVEVAQGVAVQFHRHAPTPAVAQAASPSSPPTQTA